MNKWLTLIRILSLIGLMWSIAEAVQKCHPLRLANGRARTQRQGRLVRFRCLKGYEFVGRRYMNCYLGQWDFERDPSIHPPMCVKPGCQASSYVNGHFLETYKGAVVSVVCNLGYTLIGSSTVYCNGEEWNQPFPECKAIDQTPPKSCNFEEYLCGWTQDPYGDWRWHKPEEFNGRDEECLSSNDCKKSPFYLYNSGHYMLLGNSSSKIINETERLFSPVFPSDYSNNTCFTFWYLMNGSKTGYLKVYVKPEGVELTNTIPPFWIIGDQGHKWMPGYFPLFPSETPFQLVIEGMSLPGNESVIAFDDVNILSGEDCDHFRETHISIYSKTEESITEEEIISCENRCGINTTDKCDCHESCLNDDTCCSDYDIYCIVEDLFSMRIDEETVTKIFTNSLIITTEESNEISMHEGNEWNFDMVTMKTITTGEIVTMTGETYKTTERIISSEEKTNSNRNFQIHIDPSIIIERSEIDERIPAGRFHSNSENSPLSIKSDSDHSTSDGIPSGTVEAVVTVVVLLITLMVIIAFIRRRRRKKTEKENMVEDSDVRFLTSDEFLDFTLARPNDDDL